MLIKAVQKEYPKADIEIEDGYPSISIDGDTAHYERPRIEKIILFVWADFEWLVEIPARQVQYADKKTTKELEKSGQEFKQQRVILIDDSEVTINRQNGDGETAYYRLTNGLWITCDSVKDMQI